MAGGSEGGCEVRAAQLALHFVAAAIGVGDGLPGCVHSFADAAKHHQHGSEFAAGAGSVRASPC